MDLFLYHRDLRHGRVNSNFLVTEYEMVSYLSLLNSAIYEYHYVKSVRI